MNDFGVLTNRKRAVIALIHSIMFLGIAFRGFASPKAGVLHRSGATSDLILIAIYLIVASILAWLVTISRGRAVSRSALISRCARSAQPLGYCARSSEILWFPQPNICGSLCSVLPSASAS